VATRPRILLLTLALGFAAAVLPASLATAAPTQDPGASFGGVGAETSTSIAPTTTAATATTEDSKNNQTLVESEDQPETAIFTESRKVAAIIGGLVFVALAILLLTIRYIRTTKPVAPGDVSDLPFLADDVDVDDDEVFVVGLDEDKVAPATPVIPDTAGEASTTALAATPGTDHASADDDWEPKTDEHQRVEIPSGTTLARPSTAARRKTLGVSPD